MAEEALEPKAARAPKDIHVRNTHFVFTIPKGTTLMLPEAKYRAALAAGAVPADEDEEVCEKPPQTVKADAQDMHDALILEAMEKILETGDEELLNKDGTIRVSAIRTYVENVTPEDRDRVQSLLDSQ